MKPTREDWRWFNEAVERRAAYDSGRVVPVPPLPPPQPPVDWLRRGLGIAAAILACGMAAALVLWAVGPRPPTITAIPPPPPPTPQAKVVVNYTRFTTISVGNLTAVETGWQFKSSEDIRPSFQYCYVRIPRSRSEQTDIHIADTTIGVHAYDEADMAPLTRADYDNALPRCTWFPGTVPPSPTARPKGAGQRQVPAAPPVAVPAPTNTI